MLDFGIYSTLTSLLSLQWRLKPKFHPLPSDISRTFVLTASGELELLYAAPPDAGNSKTRSPVLFVHGGFGCAAYWISWMQIIARECSIPVYALSLRGHGASWNPGYFRLQYLTTIEHLGNDLLDVVNDVLRRENVSLEELTLVGHSAGGGLVQYSLNENIIGGVKGVALVGAMPNFGATEAYLEWWGKLDKWFIPRALLHFNHARSPLSSTRLVQAAFFSWQCPEKDVKDFESWMSGTESMWWPMYFMKDRYVTVAEVLSRITGWGTVFNGIPSQRLLVMAGAEDKLMNTTLMERMAVEYRKGIQTNIEAKKVMWPIPSPESDKKLENDGVVESISYGVRLVVVPEAGHHIHNDLPMDKGGRALARFITQHSRTEIVHHFWK